MGPQEFQALKGLEASQGFWTNGDSRARVASRGLRVTRPVGYQGFQHSQGIQGYYVGLLEFQGLLGRLGLTEHLAALETLHHTEQFFDIGDFLYHA